MATIAISTRSGPIHLFHKKPILPTFLNHNYTKKTNSTNCNFSSQLTMFPRTVATSFSCKVSQEMEPMVPPYNVLITGATKGIGLHLQKSFLKLEITWLYAPDQLIRFAAYGATKRSVVQLTKSLQN